MTNRMWGGRFADGPDALMEAINASIGFDKILYAQDIAGSKAHAAMLAGIGERVLRSGDLVVQLAPTCLISPYDEGTSHGTPYLYDRAVSLIFWGAGIEGGRVPGPARTVDIAPTLAGRLGIALPAGLDGAIYSGHPFG